MELERETEGEGTEAAAWRRLWNKDMSAGACTAVHLVHLFHCHPLSSIIIVIRRGEAADGVVCPIEARSECAFLNPGPSRRDEAKHRKAAVLRVYWGSGPAIEALRPLDPLSTCLMFAWGQLAISTKRRGSLVLWTFASE